MSRKWSEKELNYLDKFWGLRGRKEIAKSLGRSEEAVQRQAQNRNLGRVYAAGDGITLNSLYLTIWKKKIGSNTIKKFANLGFPIFYRTINGKKIKFVKMENFWKWLKCHKEVLDFKLLENNCFGYEPEWAKEERKKAWKKYNEKRWEGWD